MRCTVSLDDDVYEMVKGSAKARSMTRGRILSQLVRRGMASPPKTRTMSGLVIVELPGDAEQVTGKDVKKLEE